MSLGALLKEKYAQRLILKCEEFTHADGQHRQSACLSPCQSKKDIISAENLFCLSLSFLGSNAKPYYIICFSLISVFSSSFMTSFYFNFYSQR